jgi:hypothetical protein
MCCVLLFRSLPRWLSQLLILQCIFTVGSPFSFFCTITCLLKTGRSHIMSMLVCGISTRSYHSTLGSGVLFSTVGKLHMHIFLVFCTRYKYHCVFSMSYWFRYSKALILGHAYVDYCWGGTLILGYHCVFEVRWCESNWITMYVYMQYWYRNYLLCEVLAY